METTSTVASAASLLSAEPRPLSAGQQAAALGEQLAHCRDIEIKPLRRLLFASTVRRHYSADHPRTVYDLAESERVAAHLLDQLGHFSLALPNGSFEVAEKLEAPDRRLYESLTLLRAAQPFLAALAWDSCLEDERAEVKLDAPAEQLARWQRLRAEAEGTAANFGVVLAPIIEAWSSGSLSSSGIDRLADSLENADFEVKESVDDVERGDLADVDREELTTWLRAVSFEGAAVLHDLEKTLAAAR